MCRVDGEDVIPQEGDFYGGWKTSDISGGKKGMKGGESEFFLSLLYSLGSTDVRFPETSLTHRRPFLVFRTWNLGLVMDVETQRRRVETRSSRTSPFLSLRSRQTSHDLVLFL